MTNTRALVPAVAAAWLLVSISAFAHHGMAAYDLDRRITVKGSVTKFEFVNPHVLLHLTVKDDKGKLVEWVAETGSPNMMRRSGWTKNTLKAGDQITVIGQPARNGSATMRFLKVVLPDGRELEPLSAFD